MGRLPDRSRRRSRCPALGWLLAGLALVCVGPYAMCARKERHRDRCNKTVDINEDVKSPLVSSANRGKAMYCSYRFRLNPQRNDWIISVRFYRMKVGLLANSSACIHGYIQIIDGNDISRKSNRKAPGYFCGEIDREQTYISESNFIRVIFYTESLSEDTYVAFDSRAEHQFELYARFGSNPQLYPDRRGKLIEKSFCDRTFHDCRLGTCYVQSPGFPGIYPRNARCRYFIQTNSLYINPFLENEMLSIDGQHCADMIMCPVRSVTTNCPGDFIRIYDGWTETSPVIGTFCGSGKFPYALTGTGTKLLVVFVSTLAGPLLNTGFHFNVGPNPKWVGPGAAKENGSCSAVFRSQDETLLDERRIYSLATWYTPNTLCNFVIVGRSNEIIRLYFKSFRVQRPKYAIASPRDCSESLAIYDSSVPDETRVLAIFCDTWAAPVHETRDFVSSGKEMLVQFKSAVGSYTGSSLDYWIQFDFYNAYRHGQQVQNTVCDEIFSSSTSSSGIFSSPLNYLIFKRKETLQCSFLFQAEGDPFERVFLTLFYVKFGPNKRPCLTCLTDPVDKIVFREVTNNVTDIVCICNSSSKTSAAKRSSLTFLSFGSSLELQLFYEGEHIEYNYFHNKIQVFQGSYEFFHGPQCGPTVLHPQNQGELVYPFPYDDDAVENYQSIRCIWTIPITPHKDVFLWFDYLYMPGNCTTDRLEIRLPPAGHSYADDAIIVVCGEDRTVELPIINSTNMAANKIMVELRTTPALHGRFKLVWTEVMQRERQSEYSLQLGMEACPFLCHGLNICISNDLVCNGYRNCPRGQSDPEGEYVLDEDTELCRSRVVPLNWLALGLGGGGGFFFTFCILCFLRRCCRRPLMASPE